MPWVGRHSELWWDDRGTPTWFNEDHIYISATDNLFPLLPHRLCGWGVARTVAWECDHLHALLLQLHA